MHIRMYNVGFGDCFLLCDENENLLVDFGSDSPQVNLNSISDNIVNSSDKKDLSILMTHFHTDHLNGFWDTPLSSEIEVKNIYIPDIFAMNETAGKLSFLQLHVLGDIFESVTLQKRPVKITLYTLLSWLTKLKSNIILLKRGDNFNIDSKEYQVLWPSFGDMEIHKKVENAVIKTLSDINLIDINLKELMSQSDSKIKLGVIDSFIDTLLDGYRVLLNSPEGDLKETLPRIENSYKIMSNFINNTLVNLSNASIDEIKARVSSIRHQGNRLSIVFQDRPIKQYSKLLMTGDITSSDLNKIIQNKKITPCGFLLSKKFNAIKAPHHATDSHFTNQLPECKTILSSNGTPAPRHKNWGMISYQYGSFYGSHKNSVMFCTNLRCELKNLPGTSKCNNCPNTDSNWTDLSL